MHGGQEGMNDSHGDLLLSDVVGCFAGSLVDLVSEFCESCDEISNAVIIVDFCIMVVLPCVVLGRGS